MYNQAVQAIKEMKNEYPKESVLHAIVDFFDMLLLSERTSQNEEITILRHCGELLNEASIDPKLAQDAKSVFQRILTAYLATLVGICPACEKQVYSHEDSVWICPSDLSNNNKAWRRSSVTKQMVMKHQDASLCPSVHKLDGGECMKCLHIPLHGKCYDEGN